METGLIILAIVVAVAIATISYTIGADRKVKTDMSKGVLHVTYANNGYEPGMFLTLDVPVEDVISQKRVVLDVNVIRENSQK